MLERMQRRLSAGRTAACWAVLAAYGVAAFLAALHPVLQHGGHHEDSEAPAPSFLLLTAIDVDHDHGCEAAATCAACAVMMRTTGAFEAVLAVDGCRPAHRPTPVLQSPPSQARSLHIARRAPPRNV